MLSLVLKVVAGFADRRERQAPPHVLQLSAVVYRKQSRIFHDIVRTAKARTIRRVGIDFLEIVTSLPFYITKEL
jgi:hypothetical protein